MANAERDRIQKDAKDVEETKKKLSKRKDFKQEQMAQVEPDTADERISDGSARQKECHIECKPNQQRVTVASLVLGTGKKKEDEAQKKLGVILHTDGHQKYR